MHFHQGQCIWKCRQENGGHFVLASLCLHLVFWIWNQQTKLEQLERLRSEDTPPPPPPPPAWWLPIPLSHIGSQVKRGQSQSHKFKKIAKISLHATHLLKLLDKMCKYEMDPMRILEDTERTRFCPQTDRRTDGRTDRRTDGQTDKVIPVYPPINFVEAEGIKIFVH